MKHVFFFFLALSASLVQAQDYYSPTDKDKEPLARFPLKDFKMVPAVNGNPAEISYTLPVELTGEENTILMKETTLPESKIRTFKGPFATATCMVKNEQNPGCVIKHQNLFVNSADANKAIELQFADPVLRQSALEVRKPFDSGNEPIGFIGAINLRDPATATPVPAGKWNTFYHQFNSLGATGAEINLSSSENKVQGDYFFGPTTANKDGKFDRSQKGNFSDIVWKGTHLSGRWSAQGAVGWFDFTFDSNMKIFDGYWGIGKPGSPRAGRWSGEFVPQ